MEISNTSGYARLREAKTQPCDHKTAGAKCQKRCQNSWHCSSCPSGCRLPSVWLRRNGTHRPHQTLEISSWVRVKAVYDSSIRGNLFDDDETRGSSTGVVFDKRKLDSRLGCKFIMHHRFIILQLQLKTRIYQNGVGRRVKITNYV